MYAIVFLILLGVALVLVHATVHRQDPFADIAHIEIVDESSIV